MNNSKRLDALDKNYFINGGMDYNQRAGGNSTVIPGSTPTYILDRWLADRNGTWATALNLERQAVVIPGQPKLVFAKRNTATPTNATAELFYAQRIESIHAKELANNPVSLSFHYWESEFQSVDVIFAYANAKDDFSSQTEFLTINVPLNNDSAWYEEKIENQVMPDSVKNGLRVRWVFKNPENFVAMESKFTGAKLNIGEKAQGFSLNGRDLVEELIKCQRYYEKSYNLDTAPGTSSNDIGAFDQRKANSADNELWTVQFSTRKRVNPVGEVYSTVTGAAGNVRNVSNAVDVAAGISGEGESAMSPVSTMLANIHVAYHWTAEAEL